jgi:hypothetical protein
LISGTGFQGDFSQFIVINGEFYSVWEVILLLEQYNSGQGSSKNYDDASDPVTISAEGLTQVWEQIASVSNKRGNLMQAYVRSKQQNQIIESLGLRGHFYPSRLLKLKGAATS